MTHQYHPASMAAWLSFTGISHYNLLSHILSIFLSTVNSSPRPWDHSTLPKLQYFGHLMQRVDSLEKTLILVSHV